MVMDGNRRSADTKLQYFMFLNKTVESIRTNSPGLHKALRKLGASNGEVDKRSFQLEEHQGFSDQKIADDLAFVKGNRNDGGKSLPNILLLE